MGGVVSVGLGGCAGLLAGGAAGSAAPAANITASPSVTVSSPSFFNYVGLSTKILLVSPSGLLADNPWLEGYIIDEQCRFHTPDPPVLVPNQQDKDWTFAGRLDSDRYVEALEYRRVFLPGVSGPQQVSAWPLKLETLSELPDAYMTKHLAFLADSKLSAAQQQALAHEYVRESGKIREVTERLERTYDPQRECSQG